MRTASLVVLAVTLALPACSSGPKLVKVSGKVSYNQKPLKSIEGVTIIFHPVADSAGDTYPATPLEQDGSFSVPGRTGKGIPEGKYKISAYQMTVNAAAAAEAQKINDMFPVAKTQIVWEVAGDTTIDLDLSKPTGK